MLCIFMYTSKHSILLLITSTMRVHCLKRILYLFMVDSAQMYNSAYQELP